MHTIHKLNVAVAFDRFHDLWSPRIAASVNDTDVKFVKVKGEFAWHHHVDEDELFWVVRGRLEIQLRDGHIALEPGEMVVIPRGIEHHPVANDETWIVLIEPRGTRNTGNLAEHELTTDPLLTLDGTVLDGG